MSVKIAKKHVSAPELEKLRKLLTITPNKTKFLFDDEIEEKNGEVLSIECFMEDKKYIYIPKRTAEGFFQKSFDREYPSANFEFDFKLRKKQVKAHKEATKKLEENGGVVLNLPTGFGKTTEAILLSAERGLKTLVMMTYSPLLGQWEAAFQSRCPGVKTTIISSKGKYDKKADVFICLVQRVKKMDKKDRRKIGFLIIDEAHSFCTPTRVQPLLMIQPRYIVVCTATYERDDGTLSILKSLTGKSMVKRKPTAKLTVIKINTGIVHKEPKAFNKSMEARMWAFNKLMENMSKNPKKIEMISKFVKMNKGRKFLITSNRINQVKLLKKEIKKKKISVDSFFGDDKTYKDADVLVSLFEKVGTGFDQESFLVDEEGNSTWDNRRFDTAINSATLKKKRIVYQWIGRVIGRTTKNTVGVVVDFVDANQTLQNHWKIRQNLYEAYGKTQIYSVDDIVNIEEFLQIVE